MTLPYPVMQEIRNLLAIHCREIVMVDKADGETSDGQKVLCEKVFHASAGYSSVLDLFMKGQGNYAACFIKTDIENNREGNERHAQLGQMMELKTILHCDNGKLKRGGTWC